MSPPGSGEWGITRQFMADFGYTNRQDKWIFVGWNVFEQGDYNFVVYVIHHELGHVVGFSGTHSNCPINDSIMAVRQPGQGGTSHVACADYRKLLQSCAPPTCPDYCNYEDPCPTEPEQPAVSCPISGPTDICAYPGTGCPEGEEVSPYGNCCYQFNSPILIDLEGDGFELTGLDSGVIFSIGPVLQPYYVSWTRHQTDDAWLVLDRDGNGTIDTGKELFGNFAPQPDPPGQEMKNGFRALAVFDQTAEGGNRDGVISRRDAVFPASGSGWI
jgi:hypothetical protein